MPLFRKRRESGIVGPDGTTYAPVDTETAHGMATLLCNRAVESLDRPVPPWVRHLLEETFGFVVRGLRDEWDAAVPEEAARYAFTAAKSGYEARAEEFAFLEQDAVSPDAGELVEHRHVLRDRNALDAVAEVASTLMNASHRAPHDSEFAHYLAPVGVGHQLHSQMVAVLTACLLGVENGDIRDVSGISVAELGLCVRYGYYVHACAVSLPDEARAEVERVGRAPADSAGPEQRTTKAETIDELALELCNRTIPRLERRAPPWVTLLMEDASGYVLRHARGDWDSLIPEAAAGYAYTAAKSGYEARVEEFESLKATRRTRLSPRSSSISTTNTTGRVRPR